MANCQLIIFSRWPTVKYDNRLKLRLKIEFPKSGHVITFVLKRSMFLVNYIAIDVVNAEKSCAFESKPLIGFSVINLTLNNPE